MKLLSHSTLVVAITLGLAAAGTSALAYDGTYLNAQQVDLTKLLAPPPAPESAQEQAELARVLDVQRTRTPEQVTRALADVKESVFRFADVLGAPFSETGLPKTAALFVAAQKDAGLIAKSGKDYFRRARPFVTHSDVHPIVPTTNTKGYYGSYPSGHATFGYLSAILLSQMVPEKRAELFARGREYGENRIVDGVHYESDIEAGRMDGTIVAAALMANPKFQQDFSAAKAELREALGLK